VEFTYCEPLARSRLACTQRVKHGTGLPRAAAAEIPAAGSATTGSTYRLRNLFSQPLQLLLGLGTTRNLDHPFTHLRHRQTRNFRHCLRFWLAGRS
jgi:hypothetical protein